ncbi:MAG: hypothetical protein GXO82_00560 [Chlorobi bacterium]|nr:hypothetical protein [Chlorobiota bacterium]
MRVVIVTALMLLWCGAGSAQRADTVASGSNKEHTRYSVLIDSLRCVTAGTDTVRYNAVLQAYSPDPFSVFLTLHNEGSGPVNGVRACLRIPDALSLADPLDSCSMISTILPGDSATIEWRIRIPSPILSDTVLTVEFHFGVDTLISTCQWNVFIGAFRQSPLRCELRAPDSILFRDTTYVPQEFPVHLVAWNSGIERVFDVQALLLHDYRFNIVDTLGAFRLLADSLDAGDTVRAVFHLRVNPRMLDGVDRLRVMITGRNLSSSICEHELWVQHAMRPELSLTCRAEVDSLRFDEALATYIPNPFRVTVVVANKGEVPSRQTRLFFAGPPRFTPVSGSPLVNIGELLPGVSVTHSWMMRALPRTVGRMDSLILQVRGVGGYENAPLFEDCRVPIYVPAARASSYTVHCEAPDSIIFAGGRYSPDPFEYVVTVRNSGRAVGMGINVTLLLPAGVELDAGESVIKTLPDLQPGEETRAVYRLRPIPRGDTTTVRICAEVKDNAGHGGACCRDVLIPRTDVGKLEIQCSGPSALVIDSLRGDYSPNPFSVRLLVRNTGLDALRNLTAVILPQSPDVQVIGNPQQQVTTSLPPGDSAVATWRVMMQARQQDGTVEIRVQVRADDIELVECVVRVFVPGMGKPQLAMLCQTSPADTLHYLISRNDYERNPFTVTATVSNIGSMQAKNVRVLVIPGNGVALAAGEVSEKALVPGTLGTGETGVVSWNVHPVAADSGALRDFTMIATADNASEENCFVTLFVVGIPRLVNLAIPADNLLQYGERILVPVLIDEIAGKRIEQYRLRIAFDKDVVSCTGVVTENSLTASGWNPSVKLDVGPGIVEISSAAAPGSALTAGAGPLFHLQMEAVFGAGNQALLVARSPIRIDTADVNAGMMRVKWTDGLVTVSGECVEPMNAGPRFVLFPNSPNPFNPSTRLRFRIDGGQAVFTRLIVTDRFGRIVSTLVDTSLQPGDYSVVFNANGLSTGVYFTQLIIGQRVQTRKILLLK